MKLFTTNVARWETKEREVAEYDNLFATGMVDELSVTISGYKEWSASLRLTNGIRVEVEHENGVVMVTLWRGTAIVDWDRDDDVVYTDVAGNGWTIGEMYDGIVEIAEKETLTNG